MRRSRRRLDLLPGAGLGLADDGDLSLRGGFRVFRLLAHDLEEDLHHDGAEDGLEEKGVCVRQGEALEQRGRALLHARERGVQLGEEADVGLLVELGEHRDSLSMRDVARQGGARGARGGGGDLQFAARGGGGGGGDGLVNVEGAVAQVPASRVIAVASVGLGTLLLAGVQFLHQVEDGRAVLGFVFQVGVVVGDVAAGEGDGGCDDVVEGVPTPDRGAYDCLREYRGGVGRGLEWFGDGRFVSQSVGSGSLGWIEKKVDLLLRGGLRSPSAPCRYRS